jgi:hypothetical protein
MFAFKIKLTKETQDFLDKNCDEKKYMTKESAVLIGELRNGKLKDFSRLEEFNRRAEIFNSALKEAGGQSGSGVCKIDEKGNLIA